ncbi:hypothetical protein [Desulfurivibrio alkaliphilus]|uniref:Uncharacterized protein n=1 Tax=Desulfurivibrio alkaliphilus (strain DSM 19089 / UNIQEM U267 / AHT2) TaxID=589865 RepID=D6Z252_DESAT|nr:hypothetical protein [Desulfurivibrio alkaliphilus]ADH85627.1 conserved hypothetical protein [Desulfurivibrio alkaliphilus AHT 2]
MMRPAGGVALFLLVLLVLSLALLGHGRELTARQAAAGERLAVLAAGLGLSDLCLATEARYTRHPAVSDPLAPFMSHPGAIEHFPTGSFWAPPPAYRRQP